MDLQRESAYEADPYAVFGMLTDQEFLERRAVETSAVRHQVSVTNDAGGTRTQTYRWLPADELPDFVRRIVGDTIEVDEVIAWGAPEPDGARTAELRVEVARAPVRAEGTIRLVADGPGRTREIVELTIKASMPIVGRKLEEAAAPAVLAALETEEQLGGRWLRERT